MESGSHEHRVRGPEERGADQGQVVKVQPPRGILVNSANKGNSSQEVLAHRHRRRAQRFRESIRWVVGCPKTRLLASRNPIANDPINEAR
jgi:hypothetical protein